MVSKEGDVRAKSELPENLLKYYLHTFLYEITALIDYIQVPLDSFDNSSIKRARIKS